MDTVKIFSLLVRTIAKPVANTIKNRTKSNPNFRAMCISVAQWTHKAEMNLKMKFLGYNKEKIRPLNDAKAIEAGANFLGESIIFTIAGSLIVFETLRTRRNKANERNEMSDNITMLLSDRTRMENLLVQQQETMNELREEMSELKSHHEAVTKMLDEILTVSMRDFMKRH
ncbi:OPA3-domain-containing protein [Basidiobolus meristosporus CBS 931.73]|uniref:OPA3-domain-containing protein n=1 Tax=Basidiobolus meristosporus CBS 931.73 TaxID=1314790 RepID=A0A1Y1Y147_9FUNG|nr:OPA3-domain-containing protein [Basidiobolus meristosporus CBS 931.73]|eukprot:ORX91727.1 OPA3-domain-containing protein [Basidiobolus meristosporus CBS 931.73]